MSVLNENGLLQIGFTNVPNDGISIQFKEGRLYYVGCDRFKYFIGYTPLEQFDKIDTINKVKQLLSSEK